MAVVVASLCFFGLRMRGHARSLRLPAEVLYALPVYALLIAGALGRDAQVVRALVLGSAGSLVLIAASGIANARTEPVRGRWLILHATVLLAANLALFYVVLYRAELLDNIGTTFGGGDTL